MSYISQYDGQHFGYEEERDSYDMCCRNMEEEAEEEYAAREAAALEAAEAELKEAITE